MAKRLLAARGVTPREIAIDGDEERRNEMLERTGRRSVPQIFIGERHVGGYDDLAALDHAGGLQALL
jgi:glutaredoxin 3